MVASEASKEAVWLRKFLAELGVVPHMDRPIVIYCDNSRAVSQCKEPRNHKKGKHIERKYHLIREFIQKNEILVDQISSTNSLVDPFTKPLTEKVFRKHLDVIGVGTYGLS